MYNQTIKQFLKHDKVKERKKEKRKRELEKDNTINIIYNIKYMI